MTVLISDGREKLENSIRHILDTFLTEADYIRGVFIKPNIVFPVKAAGGEITPPTLVRALVFTLREHYRDVKITLGEGVAAGCDPQENFRSSGYAELARDLHIPLIDLHEAERRTMQWKFGKLDLPRIAFDCTYINLPVLKASSACVISGALKNQKGLVLPETKKHFHRLGLHSQVAELNHLIQPTLTIMDCSRFFGRNSLISGDNCGEIDALACGLLGIDEPEHIMLARSAQVFTSGYTVLGDNIDARRISSRPAVKEFKRLGRLRLWSNPQACTMCRYLFRDIQANWYVRPNFFAALKLFLYSIKGAEVIMGLNPNWRKEYDKVICIGACTRNVAKDGGYIHIPGCPPDSSDLYKNLP